MKKTYDLSPIYQPTREVLEFIVDEMKEEYSSLKSRENWKRMRTAQRELEAWGVE